MKLLFATHNAHKLLEVQQLVPAEYEVVGLSDLGLDQEIPETGQTIEENSSLKAHFLFDRFGLPCFADDSGLEVAALNGEPGVFSARYAGEPKNDEANLLLLLQNLTQHSDRTAQFKTVITYVDEAGNLHVFTGTVKGTITQSPQGSHGFGYDPIFQPEGHSRTFAEMDASQKNEISHRARAIKQFIHFLHQRP